MAVKYYAVKKGKKPGVYDSWDICKTMVHGFPGAIYKSFQTKEEALEFLEDKAEDSGLTGGAKQVLGGREFGSTEAGDMHMPDIYAFVDGSYQAKAKVYGYGGFLMHYGKKEILQGAGTDTEMASMRNVAGEVLGSMAAIERAVELGLPEITIYYDYMGIEMWADGSWKRNKKGTIAYYDYICSVKDKIKIHFVKVRGHSGVDGNEEADRLAKEAVGN